MITKVFPLFFMTLISSQTYGVDVSIIERELQQCPNYDVNNSQQRGIMEWLKSVDQLNGCNDKKVNQLASLRTTTLIDTNLALLKLEYKFCAESKSLNREVAERLRKLEIMKEKCTKRKPISNKKRIYSHKVNEAYTRAYSNIEKLDSYINLGEDQKVLLLSTVNDGVDKWGEFVFYSGEKMNLVWIKVKDTKEL